MKIEPGTVVYSFKTKKGEDAIIRYPIMSDVSDMTQYINTLSTEDVYVTFSGEQISYNDETIYLEDQVRKIQLGETVKLVCIVNGKMVGISDVYRNIQGRRRSWHIGIFGISVAKEYRSDGIGYELARVTIDEAKKNIRGLRIITLSVYKPNDIAMNLYRKLGFKEYGLLPKAVWYKDTYIDEISMYLDVI